MEKIIQINYQSRNISIEESAYNEFQQYENELKQFFFKEEGGEETFADLQYRMAEILEQKNISTSNAVSLDDIHELIETIGKPSDLGSDETDARSEKQPHNDGTERKKLYRNKNKKEKVIAGVCSGIANYFSIDPIAVRIAFAVFTLFNIATFFSFNVGILAYILFWVLLEPAYIKTNIQRKLFRNPKDKVIGGVCSGLAQFFNTDAWVVRLIFLAPFILGIATNSSHFGGKSIQILGHSFFGLAFISYLILLVIVPVAKSATDYMLLKGEPINISTIQNSTSMTLVTQNSNSGLSKFLKVIAYIIIFFFAIFMIPIAFTILVGSVFSYNIADIVLFSTLNKTLALFTLLFFVALPLLGIFVWIIRKIAGFKKQNRSLRMAFIFLNVLGWISAFALLTIIVKDNNTYVSKPTTQSINIESDTLFIEPLRVDSNYSENVIFEFNQMNFLLEKTTTSNEIKAVRLKYKQSEDTTFRIEIEKSAFGRNRYEADKNAVTTVYETNLVGNTLYLSSILSISNQLPYHFQNVKVTIYVPKNKTLIVSEKLKKQLKHSIRTNNKNFYYNSQSSKDIENDDIITFDEDESKSTITVNDNTIRFEEDDSKREANQIMDDAKRDAQFQIDEANRELENSNREAQQLIEDSKREAQLKIDEVKRNLEQSKLEAKLKIEEAKRSANK